MIIKRSFSALNERTRNDLAHAEMKGPFLRPVLAETACHPDVVRKL